MNNAGIVRFNPLLSTSLDEYNEVIAVNQIGVFLGMKAAAPAIAASGGGSIVNVSSIEGLFGTPGLGAYVASKFAVRGMTKVAALELAPLGIRVNSIHPGAIDTPMLREAVGDSLSSSFPRAALGRIGTPEEVAKLALFLASDDSSYCTGAEFLVDGGCTAGQTFDEWVH